MYIHVHLPCIRTYKWLLRVHVSAHPSFWPVDFKHPWVLTRDSTVHNYTDRQPAKHTDSLQPCCHPSLPALCSAAHHQTKKTVPPFSASSSTFPVGLLIESPFPQPWTSASFQYVPIVCSSTSVAAGYLVHGMPA